MKHSCIHLFTLYIQYNRNITLARSCGRWTTCCRSCSGSCSSRRCSSGRCASGRCSGGRSSGCRSCSCRSSSGRTASGGCFSGGRFSGGCSSSWCSQLSPWRFTWSGSCRYCRCSCNYCNHCMRLNITSIIITRIYIKPSLRPFRMTNISTLFQKRYGLWIKLLNLKLIWWKV